ncbi:MULTISPECIES: LacI family DNA-binding transcriptional regulator [unclassified Cellulophaga]|uniref:LacI family DNA-binding transcriptional regulator n=1 Tax=unclassified Cellulophaga TaxID=2634405 RepID=UPI0026E30888|nr:MULTISPECIES: LacI family DNA-binding transcriptional regulator [unclassified Cellulophaga]MDO6492698.1 LacI family DNA-binding transcriptional regulator [Cellulophaga sp. 2_MG-2023]MDO6495955.1 LacI family DNA-binding transcriptional regulator [Cellulophaga sp. 3_MG-2023]
MKHITIKDVAKKLNVSISTVSRAFNNKYDINEETKQRILKTANELGYKPNPIAKKLSQQRSFTVGIIVPEFSNNFFPEVMLGAQEVLLKEGYQALIMQSNHSWEVEKKNVETLVNNMVDGLIISLTSENKNNAYYNNLIKQNIPIVFFNRTVDQIKASKVLFDDYKWAMFATEHLIVQGYKNIIHLEGDKNLTLTKNRLRGFTDAHKKYKLAVGKIIPCGFKMEDGERVAQEIIDNNEVPRAIFAANDSSAVGAISVFKKNGYSIPKDIAIVGFTESNLAKHTTPTLTSVEQPTNDIGQTAAKLLLEQINTKGLFVPQTIVLNGRLNIRDSSVKII